MVREKEKEFKWYKREIRHKNLLDGHTEIQSGCVVRQDSAIRAALNYFHYLNQSSLWFFPVLRIAEVVIGLEKKTQATGPALISSFLYQAHWEELTL